MILLFRELKDRVVDEPLEGLAALIGKLEVDRHAPGGFKVGNGEGDLFSIEGGAGNFPLLFVEVLGSIVLGSFEIPSFDTKIVWLHRFLVNFIREGQGDGVFGGLDLGGKIGCLI